MSDASAEFWQRSLAKVKSARLVVDSDPDTAAELAYYAAFNAVSALFAHEGRLFSKHSAVQAAVHRDLVRTGRLSEELGDFFSELMEVRQVATYGMDEHITRPSAEEAIRRAVRIQRAIHTMRPSVFPGVFPADDAMAGDSS